MFNKNLTLKCYLEDNKCVITPQGIIDMKGITTESIVTALKRNVGTNFRMKKSIATSPTSLPKYPLTIKIKGCYVYGRYDFFNFPNKYKPLNSSALNPCIAFPQYTFWFACPNKPEKKVTTNPTSYK
jgi:hypothetical protein